MTPLSRRQFLLRGAGLGIGLAVAPSVLTACGGGGESGLDLSDINLVQRFPKDVVTPGRVRLPVSLANDKGVIGAGNDLDIPDTLRFVITDIDNYPIFEDPFVVKSHVTDVPQPYWPVVVDIDTVGLYVITLVGSDKPGASFQIFDPKDVPIPVVGQPLLPVDTPTVSDSRGIDPICTRTPDPCPLHDVNLRDALASGKPVVYLLGTPAYCQTGTCSPALDAVLSVREEVGDAVIFVHGEVYTDSSATTPAKHVTDYKMTFEPALFITDAKGTLVDRLDAIFDAEEVRETLSRNGIS
jgi:hypothetical protein